jgi:MarR family transcriptional regulator, transcriptional regulator for hemolysin
MAGEGRESSVRRLMRAAKGVRLCMEEALSAAGASYATFVILDATSIEDGLSQRELARRISIEGPPLTRHLDRMEAEGLVERRRDPHDRRIQRVYPTAAGARLYGRLCPLVAALEQDLLADVPVAESGTFARVLDKVLAHVRARQQADAESAEE